MTLDVPLGRWSARGLANASWRTLSDPPVGGVYVWLEFILAAYAVWRQPTSRSAQLFLLLQTVPVAAALSTTGSLLSVADTLVPAAFYLARLLGSMVFWLVVPPLGLHFILSFPAPTRVLRSGWTHLVMYGAPWGVLGVIWVTGNAPLVFHLMSAYNLASLAVVIVLLVTVRDEPRRAQVRWFGFGYAFSSLITVLHGAWQLQALPAVPWLSRLLIEECLCDFVYTVCTTIALLWYRLFDIDVILNRTLVYGGLTAGVVGAYALVVRGLGSLLGLPASGTLSLLATGLIAVLFDPLRRSLQRGVNRLLYGERDEPYQVLRTLSDRVGRAAHPSAVLPAITQTIASTLKLPYVAITLDSGEQARVVAFAGTPAEDVLTWPLVHQGETVGELCLTPRVGDVFKPAERNLLDTVAHQASVAAFIVRQYLDLQRSREALVAAREEERRRIRRDLHDGLGPELATLAVKLDAARNLLKSDATRVDDLLLELKAQTQDALSGIRRLVYALRPPALDDLGLEGALREQARGYDGALSVSLHLTGDLAHLPAATEVACYRIVQEALANVVRHAHASRCDLTVHVAEQVTVDVQDNGQGVPDHAQGGVGLRSMRERAEELGGHLTVVSSAGGTRLHAVLPIPSEGGPTWNASAS
ncbi:sensor histidine kinase [Deinococcus sonorensis]|uniref:histidine kinase n=2 Tax=Deinococcus sonorensis TaxID=309891 RepID=A0AAU7U6H2_9DEIO